MIMRLELLCEMRMVYDRIDGKQNVVLIRPYSGSEEGSAFIVGTGMVTGEQLSGTVRWVNHPHRRSDATLLPDLHGVITTDDGASVFVTMEGGRAIFPTPKGNLLVTTTFEAEAEAYRWLNTTYCVLEGVIDLGAGEFSARVYRCVNELAEADEA
jgi:hypothetical protein